LDDLAAMLAPRLLAGLVEAALPLGVIVIAGAIRSRLRPMIFGQTNHHPPPDHRGMSSLMGGFSGGSAFAGCFGLKRSDKYFRPALLSLNQPLTQNAWPPMLAVPLKSGCVATSFSVFLNNAPLFLLSPILLMAALRSATGFRLPCKAGTPGRRRDRR